MKPGETLQKKLQQKFQPSSMVEMRYKENDIAFKTYADGNTILPFTGKRKEDGSIKGLRFARKLIRDKEGNLVKDHWDQKGKAT